MATVLSGFDIFEPNPNDDLPADFEVAKPWSLAYLTNWNLLFVLVYMTQYLIWHTENALIYGTLFELACFVALFSIGLPFFFLNLHAFRSVIESYTHIGFWIYYISVHGVPPLLLMYVSPQPPGPIPQVLPTVLFGGILILWMLVVQVLLGRDPHLIYGAHSALSRTLALGMVMVSFTLVAVGGEALLQTGWLVTL